MATQRFVLFEIGDDRDRTVHEVQLVIQNDNHGAPLLHRVGTGGPDGKRSSKRNPAGGGPMIYAQTL